MYPVLGNTKYSFTASVLQKFPSTSYIRFLQQLQDSELPGVKSLYQQMCIFMFLCLLSLHLPKPLHFQAHTKHSFLLWHPNNHQAKRLVEGTANVCPVTMWTLHSQKRFCHCRRTTWVFVLYLITPFPKGKKLNYILVLYSLTVLVQID